MAKKKSIEEVKTTPSIKSLEGDNPNPVVEEYPTLEQFTVRGKAAVYRFRIDIEGRNLILDMEGYDGQKYETDTDINPY